MTKTTVMWLALIDMPVEPEPCLDFDDECKDVESPTKCWLYQPERGFCPYLPGPEEKQ